MVKYSLALGNPLSPPQRSFLQPLVHDGAHRRCAEVVQPDHPLGQRALPSGWTTLLFSGRVTHSSLWCLQLYYPNPQGMRDLLQALDTDSRLDLLPTIWKGTFHTV